MSKTCLYCKQEYEPDPKSEYQTKYEGCAECEKETNSVVNWWAQEILSVPLEIRQSLLAGGLND